MLKKTEIGSVSFNPFTRIGEDNMLITAGIAGHFNTMTAAWGGLGVLWGRNAATIYINPARYTFGFANESDFFTLCFFEPGYRDKLMFCGTHSGRDTDKVKECGFTPVASEFGAIYFAEASLVFVCKKMYSDDFRQEFIRDGYAGPSVRPPKRTPLGDKNMPERPPLPAGPMKLHRFYIGEVLELLADKE
jgi:hypothetical protein